MRVFVKNMRGESLMPCSQRKARLLLKEGKAKIVGYKPFTIQLLHATGETIQEVHLGVDTGARHIGIAATSSNKVLVKGEIELRDDVHENMINRSRARKLRRNRKTRYRKAKFLNRKRRDGWLPPTVQNKEQAKLRSKRDKLTKGSRQYRKYSRAIYKLKVKTDKQILDCIHKISKLYLDYCIEHGISKVYYGDLDSCTRGHKNDMSKFTNQKLRDWCYGLLMLQLENKLSRYGIELVKVSEAYSSQTCPHCGHRHKPTGRNYECQCGYKQHRDVVGAMNILNFNEKDIQLEKYNNLKYLRIA